MKALNRFFQSLQRTTSGGKYIPFIDGLRFLAIMPVVLLHANERLLKYNLPESMLNHWEGEVSYLISRGAIGVMIFFAISGFILSLPFAKQRPFNYKTYLGRRLTRLEPPYIFWMTCFGLVYLIQNGPTQDLFGHYLASLTYTHNIIYQDFSIINPVAWSLEVEIQYYLIAPFLAILYFRNRDIKHRRIALIVSTIFFIAYQHKMGWQYLPIRASLLGQMQHFLVGLLMADLYVNAPDWRSRKSLWWDLLAPFAIVILAFTWTEEFGKSLVFASGLALLFICAFKGRVFPKFLSLPFISIVGGMCYTIYLTHLPLLELLGSLTAEFWQSSTYLERLSKFLIIAIPSILLSSIIFFKAIEQPFMSKEIWLKLKRRWIYKNEAKAIN